MKFTKKNMTMLVAATLSICVVSAQTKVYYVSIKDGEEVTASPIKEHPQPEKFARGGRITIFPGIKFQTMEGIGGTFSEIGAEALLSLKKKEQQVVADAIFGAEGGAFSFCRTPMGASDFSRDAYSYSETADDYELKSFSIDRDKKSLIPAIKMAQTSNPELKLFASPWSPPAWMKNSNQVDGGDKTKKKNTLKNTNEIYGAYALYFAKYIESYKAEGINIDRVLIQEDVDVSAKYPSNLMGAGQIQKLALAIRPLFKEKEIETKVWAGSFKTMPGLEMLQFAANKKCLNSVDGIAMQNTILQYIFDLKSIAPSKPVMNSEGVAYNGANTMRQTSSRFGEIVGYINAGLPNYCYANMISNETAAGGWENKQNSLVTIEGGKVTYNPDFAIMALFGRFIKPGSVRIASNGRSANSIVTILDGENIYLFVKNDRDAVAVVDCVDAINGGIKAEIPAKSIAVVAYQVKPKKK